MFGQSKFVTRGVIFVFALLVYGTASADSNVQYDFENLIQNTPAVNFSATSVELSEILINKPKQEMEEVMVIGRQEFVLPGESLLDKVRRVNSNVEYFPGLRQSFQADRTNRLNLHTDREQARFIEVFRVRFGG